MTSEGRRLEDARDGVPWRIVGPVPQRAPVGHGSRGLQRERRRLVVLLARPGTISRAIAGARTALPGISDEQQRLCFAIALWNEHDPILKERLFGLTNSEGNHGEDVKEYYFYVDNMPTPRLSAMALQVSAGGVPLRGSRAARTPVALEAEMEYELVDTGVFDDDRYFDVEVEYAKASPDDIALPHHRPQPRAEAAPIHVLPTLWFRNTWSWAPFDRSRRCRVARMKRPVVADHDTLGRWYLHVGGAARSCCSATTRPTPQRLWGTESTPVIPKDAINESRGERRGRRREPGTRRAPRPRRTPARRRRPAGSTTCRCDSTARAPDAARRPLRRRRRRDRHTPRRGRRVLRRDHARRRERRCGGGHAPGVGGNAVVEAVLLLRRRPVAPRAQPPPVAPAGGARQRATSRGSTWPTTT